MTSKARIFGDMATVLIGASDALTAIEQLLAWADEVHFAYAWASSNRGLARHWRALDTERVVRGVVGVHFAQTEPHALRVLAATGGRVRVRTDVSGVFHPKVIVGRKGRLVRALIGSSNFTSGGFAANAEVNVALELPLASRAAQDLLRSIEDWWKTSQPITASWLARYEKEHAARPQPWRTSAPMDAATGWVTMNIPWSAYYDLITGRDREVLSNGFRLNIFDEEDGALRELDAIRAPFAGGRSFRDIAIGERRRAGGYGRDSTGWFGSMRANRTFQGLLRDDHRGVARLLDAVPHEGPPEQASGPAVRFVEAMLKRTRIGMSGATRLLLAKRPDLFLMPNSANAERWTQEFGPPPSTAREYMEFHERLWDLPWHRSKEPRQAQQRRLWRGRAATLDTLLYDAFPPISE